MVNVMKQALLKRVEVYNLTLSYVRPFQTDEDEDPVETARKMVDIINEALFKKYGSPWDTATDTTSPQIITTGNEIKEVEVFPFKRQTRKSR
jgi:hypothetical protein